MEIKARARIWLENEEGEKIFGTGICELLKGVKEKGSLSESAKEMAMSYNKAHNVVKTMEKRLGFKLLDTKIGGVRGGGSSLTEEGYYMIERYDKLVEKLKKDVNDGFEMFFSDLNVL